MLPRAIVTLLESPKLLAQLAAELHVTDARILWYLAKLSAVGRVKERDGLWGRGPHAHEYLASPEPATDDCTIIPGRTVYDFQQAFADAAAGMFGAEYVQGIGEHGGRLSLAEATEFRERLISLIAEYFAPEDVDRSGTKYGFHWVITPSDLHPLDDD